MKTQAELTRLWKEQRQEYERTNRMWAPPGLAMAGWGSRPGAAFADDDPVPAPWASGWYSSLSYAERKAMALRDDEDEQRLIAQEETYRKWAIPREGEVEGIATLYGVVDGEGYRHLPGAFKDANPRAVTLYFSHREEYGLLGSIRALFEVARKELPAMTQALYPEATGGLIVVYRFDDSPNGRAAVEWVQSGQVKGLSVGYLPHKSRSGAAPGSATKVKEIVSGQLHDVSLALNPAVPGTMWMCGDSRFSLLLGQYARRFG